MEVQIGNRVAEVELISKDKNFVRLSINGEEYEVDVTMLEEGVYSILHNGKSYNTELTRSDDNKTYKVHTTFSTFDVKIIDEKAKYLRMRKEGDDRQDNKVITPMPGKVVSIPVSAGDTLSKGDTVIVIEAMKMQNSIKVASDCTIKEILVNEGEAINANQLLIHLELN
ncbi:MAG: biotin/lipoyl-containing protein [Bacteroidales bacterium]